MTERPGTDDDDKTPTLPEVTVPPWLRAGPAADSSVSTPPPTAAPAPDADAAAAERADVGQPADQPAVPPTRITLGAHDRVAAGGPATGGPAAQGGAAPEERPAGGPVAPGVERTDERPLDDLSTLPLRVASRAPGSVATPTPGGAGGQRGDSAGGSVAVHEGTRDAGAAAPAPVLLSRRPVRIALAVVAGAAVLGGSAVLGFVVVRGASGSGTGPVAAAATPGCEDRVEEGRTTGSGPGSLDSPAGAVLAFDHAYYVDRSAAKAFEAVAPSSRMTEEQLRTEGIDRLAEGTAHCVRVRELAPTLLEVDLTEFPPGADPVLIRQRIRVAENPDGTWGIVSITPAG